MASILKVLIRVLVINSSRKPLALVFWHSAALAVRSGRSYVTVRRGAGGLVSAGSAPLLREAYRALASFGVPQGAPRLSQLVMQKLCVDITWELQSGTWRRSTSTREAEALVQTPPAIVRGGQKPLQQSLAAPLTMLKWQGRLSRFLIW